MLFKKMLRDMYKNRNQFLSIFLVTMIGIFTFSGMTAIGEGMKQSSVKYYKQTRLADAMLYGKFSAEEAEEVMSEIYDITVSKRLQLDTAYRGDTKITLQVNYIDNDKVSGMHLVDGTKFSNSLDGAWVDSEFAQIHNLKVGDNIEFVYEKIKFSKEIKGLVMQPEYLYAVKTDSEVVPDHKAFGFAFLSDQFLELPSPMIYNQLLFLVNKNEDTMTVKLLSKMLAEHFENKNVSFIEKKDFKSYTMFENEIDQMNSMGFIFPAVFLVIAVLITLTAMTRIAMSQRIQIGALKSLGFAKKKILFHYLTYGIIISMTAGIAGFITGLFVLPPLVFRFQKGFYTMPEWNGAVSPRTLLVIFLCIGGCVLSCFLAARKQLNEKPAQMMRPKAPKPVSTKFLENSNLLRKSSFYFQWNLRDLLRNPLRTLITVLGVMGCTAVILCAFGMRDTVKNLEYLMYGELHQYETKISLDPSQPTSKLSEQADRGQFLQEGMAIYDLDGEQKLISLTIVGIGDLLRFHDKNRNFIILPETGIAVTEKTAELYHLEKGDQISIRLYGLEQEVPAEIQLIVKNPLGQGFYISSLAWQEYGQKMNPTTFLSKEKADFFEEEGFLLIQKKSDLIDSLDSMLQTMNSLIVIMITVAACLGFVVLYSLGVTSFQEKLRELATLKVLGFQRSRLQKLLRKQNIWLTAIGIILGIPSGYGLLSYMLEFMGDSADFPVVLTKTSYIISTSGLMVLSILVNWLIATKLKAVNMVSALKSVD